MISLHGQYLILVSNAPTGLGGWRVKFSSDCYLFCALCEIAFGGTAFHIMTTRKLMKMCTKETQRLKDAKCEAKDTNRTIIHDGAHIKF